MLRTFYLFARSKIIFFETIRSTVSNLRRTIERFSNIDLQRDTLLGTRMAFCQYMEYNSGGDKQGGQSVPRIISSSIRRFLIQTSAS